MLRIRRDITLILSVRRFPGWEKDRHFNASPSMPAFVPGE